MTDKLPPNLLALFAPRPPLRYLPPADHAPNQRQTANISGVAQFLKHFNDPELQNYQPTESWLQRRDRLKLEKQKKHETLLTEGFSAYVPSKDPQIRGDAFKTLFVARLSYEATDSDLEREFGRFGPIERIRIVTDQNEEKKSRKKKHRGYAFIVYEREKDMKAAYKETDGIRIKDRRVLVDVERGRTVKGWRPRRFGGGLGGRGYTKAAPPRPSGPNPISAPAGPGGFRGGGFGGGFRGRGGFRGGFGDRGGGGGGFGDRAGFGGRGGIGYQGGGGFGGRGGYGGQSNGISGGQPPPNAPSGPAPRSGGYGGRPHDGQPNGPGAGSSSGGYGDSRGGRSFDDNRSSYRGSRGDYSGDRGDRSNTAIAQGSNREPVRPRESRDGGGYRDRDRDRDASYGGRYGRDDDSSGRKRYHDGDNYDDHRSKRRY
ncbi:MAG: hypothetical protein M1829_005918 [Trizodia sp. TS-e1964]|nr:MAG: hypothetical protein M1829_005918 [Trizodia sp. TS-e1964]